ncbi:DUF6294 family protein [Streptomyces sp. NPDC021096]|uniref:DUF6294 family protein n=1 Tax=Streptomyces sp. NPDC021096 TaxID=3154792 RepID=UPI0033DCFA00
MAGCVETSTDGSLQEGGPELASKVFVWGELHVGDCEQRDGRIEFNSDGSGLWSCVTKTYSTGTGDIWHARFSVKNSTGLTLFQVGTFDSPEMDDGNPPPEYRWSRVFIFDEREYNDIGGVTQHYSC